MSMNAKERERGMARLGAQFMVPDIYQGDVWEVSANHGETHYVPAEVCRQEDLEEYVEGNVDRDDEGDPIATLRRGVWLARLSAPGYMDCTDYSIHATEAEAEEYLIDTYDDGEEEDTDDPNGPCSSPTGHEWIYTGTQYGGDDTSYRGEGRCYCVHCGADGDA